MTPSTPPPAQPRETADGAEGALEAVDVLAQALTEAAPLRPGIHAEAVAILVALADLGWSVVREGEVERLRAALVEANAIISMTREHLSKDHPECAYTVLGIMNDPSIRRAALAARPAPSKDDIEATVDSIVERYSGALDALGGPSKDADAVSAAWEALRRDIEHSWKVGAFTGALNLAIAANRPLIEAAVERVQNAACQKLIEAALRAAAPSDGASDERETECGDCAVLTGPARAEHIRRDHEPDYAADIAQAGAGGPDFTPKDWPIVAPSDGAGGTHDHPACPACTQGAFPVRGGRLEKAIHDHEMAAIRGQEPLLWQDCINADDHRALAACIQGSES